MSSRELVSKLVKMGISESTARRIVVDLSTDQIKKALNKANSLKEIMDIVGKPV
jgi:hypothetical protein